MQDLQIYILPYSVFFAVDTYCAPSKKFIDKDKLFNCIQVSLTFPFSAALKVYFTM